MRNIRREDQRAGEASPSTQNAAGKSTALALCILAISKLCLGMNQS